MGDWKAAEEALEKSMHLREGGDSFDWFLLAMAKWKLGDKEQARQWYDRAVRGMDKRLPPNTDERAKDELRRLRDEVAALLGNADSPPKEDVAKPEEKSPEPNK